MSLQDVIKINQLVRGRIDLESFNEWYAQLPPHEQRDLISFLHEFAYQAGVNDKTWAEALSFAGLGSDTDVVRDIKSFHLPGLQLTTDFRRWLAERSDDDRYTTFVILVYLFGVAEGTVFRNETLDSCNHWWHRDLLNPLIVEAILSDPQYYWTSMKDDERITHCTGCG
jgi:hypothetical protein